MKANPASFKEEGGRVGGGEGEGQKKWGTLLFQSTFTFTFKTSKLKFKVEYLKNGTRYRESANGS